MISSEGWHDLEGALEEGDRRGGGRESLVLWAKNAHVSTARATGVSKSNKVLAYTGVGYGRTRSEANQSACVDCKQRGAPADLSFSYFAFHTDSRPNLGADIDVELDTMLASWGAECAGEVVVPRHSPLSEVPPLGI